MRRIKIRVYLQNIGLGVVKFATKGAKARILRNQKQKEILDINEFRGEEQNEEEKTTMWSLWSEETPYSGLLSPIRRRRFFQLLIVCHTTTARKSEKPTEELKGRGVGFLWGFWVWALQCGAQTRTSTFNPNGVTRWPRSRKGIHFLFVRLT